jgi:pimeloyl-ACP methyl ester carboxylesterase
MSITLLQSERHGTVCVRQNGPDRARAESQTEPVVLLHGVGMQSQAWAPQIEALGSGYPVLAVDLPGHGGSDPLMQGAMLPDFVNWLDDALSALGLDAVNLAGHSMGALIAAGYAISHPSRVLRLALLNGVFRRDAESRAKVAARAKQIAGGNRDIETPLARWFGPSPGEQAISNQVRAWLSEVGLGGYATAYTAFANGDAEYADRFGTLTCPMLALTGSNDPNSTPAMSHAMAAAAPHGQAVVIDGHRHMVNLTAPELVNGHLLEWLRQPLEQGVGHERD